MLGLILTALHFTMPQFDWPLSGYQGPTEKEQIDVQGDIAYDIVDFITETWPDVMSFPLSLFY